MSIMTSGGASRFGPLKTMGGFGRSSEHGGLEKELGKAMSTVGRGI